MKKKNRKNNKAGIITVGETSRCRDKRDRM